MFIQETVTTSFVDGDIAKYSRMSRRSLFPRNPSVTKKHRRHPGETKKSSHCFQVMLTVNHVWFHGKTIEIIDNGNRHLPDLSRHFAEICAIGYRGVSKFQKA